MLASLTVAVLGIGLIWLVVQNVIKPIQPAVVDLKICGPKDFSKTDLRCTENEDQFPVGTKKIYLSFDFENLGRGEQFHRKWFIDGRLFLEKSSHFTEPWEGWAWLGNLCHNDPDALDMEPGQHTLQFHASRTIEVQSFVIGPLSGDFAKEQHSEFMRLAQRDSNCGYYAIWYSGRTRARLSH